MNTTPENPELSPEEQEAYENAPTVKIERKEDESASREQMEGFVEALDGEGAKEAAQEDAAEALKASRLTKEQRETVLDMKDGLLDAAKIVEAGGEVDVKELLEHLLEERYNVTLQEFLSAVKPTKMEYLYPPTALAQEAGVWIAAKSLGVELKPMTYRELAEVRWKIGEEFLKVFGLIAKFIPEAAFVSAPATLSGEAVGRAGRSMERLNEDPNATNYDVARELTIAVLPRDSEGNVDMEKTASMLAEVGGMVQKQETDDKVLAALYEHVGGALSEQPEEIMKTIQQLDQLRNKSE